MVGIGGRALRIHRDLHGAAAIPQIDEDHPAVVAAPIHPTVQGDGTALVAFPQVPAPLAVHRFAVLRGPGTAHGGGGEANR